MYTGLWELQYLWFFRVLLTDYYNIPVIFHVQVVSVDMFCCFFQHVIQILKDSQFSLTTIYFSSKVHTCICENWHSLIFFLFFQFYIPFVQERIPWSVFYSDLYFATMIFVYMYFDLTFTFSLLFSSFGGNKHCSNLFSTNSFLLFFLFKFAYSLSSFIIATQCFHLRTNWN